LLFIHFMTEAVTCAAFCCGFIALGLLLNALVMFMVILFLMCTKKRTSKKASIVQTLHAHLGGTAAIASPHASHFTH